MHQNGKKRGFRKTGKLEAENIRMEHKAAVVINQKKVCFLNKIKKANRDIVADELWITLSEECTKIELRTQILENETYEEYVIIELPNTSFLIDKKKYDERAEKLKHELEREKV